MILVKKNLFTIFNTTPLIDVLKGKGWTGRLDWKKLILESGLPNEVRGCVFEVVKGTRLWPSEKVLVAEELIGHFRDGLATEVFAKELIVNFGDVKATAKMIRRAKIRQRNWLHHGSVCFWKSLGVVTVIYFGMMGYYSMGEADVKVDYLAGLNAEAVGLAEEERAWPLYSEGLIGMGFGKVFRDEERWDVRQKMEEMKGRIWGDEPGDGGWEEARVFLKKHGGELAQFRKAAGMEGLGFVVSRKIHEEDKVLLGGREYGEEIDFRYPGGRSYSGLLDRVWVHHKNSLEDIFTLLKMDMHLAGEEKDAGRVLANFRALVGLVRHIHSYPGKHGYYSASRLKGRIALGFSKVMSRDGDLFTAAEMRDVAHLLAGMREIKNYDNRCERARVMDMIQRSFTDDGDGDGVLTMAGAEIMIEYMHKFQTVKTDSFARSFGVRGSMSRICLPLVAQFSAGRREMVAKYESLIHEEEREMGIPLYQVSQGDRVKGDFYKAASESKLEELKYWALTYITMDYSGFRSSIERDEAYCDGLMVGLCLEIYKKRFGKYPATLAEISPRYLPSLPVDRMTGKGLMYKVVEGKAVVYGVGSDGDDDGGVVPYRKNRKGRFVPSIWGVSLHSSGVGDFGKKEEIADGDWVIWPLSDPPIGNPEILDETGEDDFSDGGRGIVDGLMFSLSGDVGGVL